MESIVRELYIKTSTEKAFHIFLKDFNEWWPNEYTWSGENLKEISIDGRLNGLCSEFGPFGFRSDWGRVTALTENKLICLKWQISPQREPIPDPDKASDLKIEFLPQGEETKIKFEHFNFQNHGNAGNEYRAMLNTENGWDYILNRFKDHCEK